jgi:REP element-mobilizing transposase RayT
MTIARSQQISLGHTPYYHCTTRCVRRAFLCGRDQFTGKNFAHRRQWLEERLQTLATIFAIDLVAYAIMSNHYHVVLRLNPAEAFDWTDTEVVGRWKQLFKVADDAVNASLVATWRERLTSLSWFMRCLNEPLARLANREDGCTGRFWEGRFKSQALLDEAALLKCMVYVDLNPIRAGIATAPETSAHTSVRARIEGHDRHLMAFADQCNAVMASIPINKDDYLQLVDWTGRVLRSDKRGAIPADIAPILERLRLDPRHWTKEMRHYGKWYYRAVGSPESLRRFCEHLGQQWLKGAGKTLVTSC